MNSISWFLYLADALDSVGHLFSFFGVIATILSAGGLLMALLNTDNRDKDAQQRFSNYNANGRTFIRHAAPCMVAFFVLSAVIPSKNTMYAMAAAQIGEQVIKSDAVQGITSDATKALQQWIKRQIEPEAKK